MPRGQVQIRRKGFHQQSVEEEDKQMIKSASSYYENFICFFSLLCFAKVKHFGS